MSSEVDRASHALFPSGGQAEDVNVKFFLGNARAVTAEELANQLNRADAQIRTGTAVRSQELDGHLTTRVWRD